MERLQAELNTLKAHRPEPPRDSFGSFVDMSNPRLTRRFSTVGLQRHSLSTGASSGVSTSVSTGLDSAPVAQVSKPVQSVQGKTTQPVQLSKPAQSTQLKLAQPTQSTQPTQPAQPAKPALTTKPAHLKTESLKRPAPSTSTHQPQRRISLFERTYMITPSSRASTTVSGTARLSTRPRRASLTKRASAGNEKKAAEKEEVTVTVSPSKKRRYTVAVMRQAVEPEAHPSYTYTPSSDRRMTLDSLLLKSGRIQNDSDSSLNSSTNRCK